jgi:hypothetical protein
MILRKSQDASKDVEFFGVELSAIKNSTQTAHDGF